AGPWKSWSRGDCQSCHSGVEPPRDRGAVEGLHPENWRQFCRWLYADRTGQQSGRIGDPGVDNRHILQSEIRARCPASRANKAEGFCAEFQQPCRCRLRTAGEPSGAASAAATKSAAAKLTAADTTTTAAAESGPAVDRNIWKKETATTAASAAAKVIASSVRI